MNYDYDMINQSSKNNQAVLSVFPHTAVSSTQPLLPEGMNVNVAFKPQRCSGPCEWDHNGGL